MTIFAGIDGGQTSTVAVVGDGERELGRGVGPPADLVGKARDPGLQVAALGVALAAARSAAGLAEDAPVAALVAGVTGFDRGESAEPDLSALADRATIVHDTEIAHAGALAGRPGIVTIAGTGSVALGNAIPGGAFVRAGGWGYFFGDEGSALWVARTALRRAMEREDRAEPSDLRERARAFFGAFSLRAIQHAFAHGDLGRPALAAFASDVLESAAAGDADAVAVRFAASRELAALVATIDARLGATQERAVSFAGGLFADGGFADGFRDALATAVPHATLLAPSLDPAAGALVLARTLARAGAAP